MTVVLRLLGLVGRDRTGGLDGLMADVLDDGANVRVLELILGAGSVSGIRQQNDKLKRSSLMELSPRTL